jgi:hypothetical protein
LTEMSFMSDCIGISCGVTNASAWRPRLIGGDTRRQDRGASFKRLSISVFSSQLLVIAHALAS